MLRVSALTKSYGGTRALGPVSFEVERGSVVGFLGPNGAGKTTLLRILSCDLRPTAGEISLDGVDALRDPHAVRTRVGFLPETPPVYAEMTVGDYLAFVARIRGIPKDRIGRRVEEVEERLHLRDRHDNLVSHLSFGYRQRVGLAQAVIHEPELVILDEPTHDLDPVQIKEIRSLVRELGGDHTVVVSSHILPEISQTCDRILVLNKGRVVADGSEQALSDRLLGAQQIVVTVRRTESGGGGDGSGAILGCLRAVEGVRDVREEAAAAEGSTFLLEAERDVRVEVCRALVEAGYGVLRLDRVQRQLETVFLEILRRGASEERSGGGSGEEGSAVVERVEREEAADAHG
jgi:ABC-2 type transport system ATP-binding protein